MLDHDAPYIVLDDDLSSDVAMREPPADLAVLWPLAGVCNALERVKEADRAYHASLAAGIAARHATDRARQALEQARRELRWETEQFVAEERIRRRG